MNIIVSNSNNKNLLAIFGLLFGTCFWGVVWYPYRLLQSAGISGSLSSLFVYTFALLMGCVVFRKALPRLFIHKRTLLILGAAAGWYNLGSSLALIEGPVMRVMLLFYLSPVWTILLMYFWLKEQVTIHNLLAVSVALLGAVVMLYQPSETQSWLSSQSDWLALSAGFAFALANAITQKSEALSIEEKSFAVWFGVMMVALVSMPLFNQSLPWPHVTLLNWAGLAVIAIFLLISTLFVQYGITHMSVASASVIFLFELVVAAISSYYLAGEIMTTREMIGGLMITCAAFYSAIKA